MNKKKRVAALIINWNGSQDTIELLRSLGAQSSSNLWVEAVVVDNVSTQEELDKLSTYVKTQNSGINVTLISNTTNVGIPAGYNQAIAAAGLNYDYYLRLDNDVVLQRGAIEKLCQALEANRAHGVRLVGGNSRFYDHPEINNGGAHYFDLIRGKSSITHPKDDVICDGVLGCIMLLDGDVVQTFAPEVFLSWLFLTTDDSEISLRCKEKGWLTYYVSQTIGLHKGARSISKVKRASGLYSVRNWSYLALRFIRPKAWFPVVLARLALTVIYKAFTGNMDMAQAFFKGVLAFFLGTPSRIHRSSTQKASPYVF
jgi:GT2 family glycosyltransferase